MPYTPEGATGINKYRNLRTLFVTQECIRSNDWAVAYNELEKNVDGSRRGLIQGAFQNLPGRSERNNFFSSSHILLFNDFNIKTV
jgi:hypothetical protein